MTGEVAVVLSAIQFMYLYRTISLMPRILFAAVFLILHSFKRLITSGKNFNRTIVQQLWLGPMSDLVLKQAKGFILKFLNKWKFIFRKRIIEFVYYKICFIILQEKMLMWLYTIKQFIKNINMFISFGIQHWQFSSSCIVKNFVKL